MMADIDAIALYASETTEPTSLVRIRRFSRPFELGFAFLAGCVGLFAVFIVVMAFAPGGPYIFLAPEGGWFSTKPETLPASAVAFGDLPVLAQVVGLIAIAFISGSKVTGYIFLSRLFGFYRRGIVFAAEPIRIMRSAGAALVIAAAAPGLMQPFVRASGALDENWFHMESVALLLVGAALFLFAQITALGMEIARENRGFI